ncbi:hypothetical protein EV130_101109 [Rhizobium azibense]|uniref:Uncharacterized protein n=1 Tax=Rhizobium azibense TaxID=1136135 RepID=A0A4R3R5X5_9HYPH|nr:hypothetical protein [Rhizobium azibense]TCU30538.1 hypothetical protein EV130_101109 [Rhizobium azibense]
MVAFGALMRDRNPDELLAARAILAGGLNQPPLKAIVAERFRGYGYL